MDKKKLEAFKKRLEDRQRELRQNVSRNEQDGRAADMDTAQDIADRASSSYTKEFLFHQSSNERQTLQMVEVAWVAFVTVVSASVSLAETRSTRNG